MKLKRSWIAVIIMVTLLLVGCTGGVEDMDKVEEKEIKEKAIQYIKNTYNKEFEISEVSKDRFTGQTYTVRGNIKDEKNTQVSIIMEPNEIRDTYVASLWTEELKPKITSLVEKYFDVREFEHITYSNGTKKDRYTGEIPSIFKILENGGDSEYELSLVLRIYEQNDQYEQGIKSFLKELKGLHFNEVGIEIFVADDKLKSAPKDIKESEYTLYRYNIYFDDIQKVDIDNHDLDQYKTVIKH